MKTLHRDDFYCWTRFDAERDLDFHSVLIVRQSGNVAIDPLPLSGHDAAHVERLGGVAHVIVTNSDHLRDALGIAERYSAELWGPAAEASALPPCRTVGDGDELLPGIRAFEMHGSKTPGELALLFEEHTLITGDLIRGHLGGRLNLLPAPKLTDPEAALASVQRLAALDTIDTILVGDGWHVWSDGTRALRALVAAAAV